MLNLKDYRVRLAALGLAALCLAATSGLDWVNQIKNRPDILKSGNDVLIGSVGHGNVSVYGALQSGTDSGRGTQGIRSATGARFESSASGQETVIYGNASTQILKIHDTRTALGQAAAYIKNDGGGGSWLFQRTLGDTSICNIGVVGGLGALTGSATNQDNLGIMSYSTCAGGTGTGAIHFLPGGSESWLMNPGGHLFGTDGASTITSDTFTARIYMDFKHHGINNPSAGYNRIEAGTDDTFYLLSSGGGGAGLNVGAITAAGLVDASAKGVKLPTSCTGLATGTLYNNAGTPAFCP